MYHTIHHVSGSYRSRSRYTVTVPIGHGTLPGDVRFDIRYMGGIAPMLSTAI